MSMESVMPSNLTSNSRDQLSLFPYFMKSSTIYCFVLFTQFVELSVYVCLMSFLIATRLGKASGCYGSIWEVEEGENWFKNNNKTGHFIATKGHLSVYSVCGVKPWKNFCGFSYLDIFSCSSGKLAMLLQPKAEDLWNLVSYTFPCPSLFIRRKVETNTQYLFDLKTSCRRFGC